MISDFVACAIVCTLPRAPLAIYHTAGVYEIHAVSFDSSLQESGLLSNQPRDGQASLVRVIGSCKRPLEAVVLTIIFPLSIAWADYACTRGVSLTTRGSVVDARYVYLL